MNSQDEPSCTGVAPYSCMQPVYGMYTSQVDLYSTHMTFPLVGSENSESLRRHLQDWGIQLPHHNAEPHQLLQLQFLFWRKLSSACVARFNLPDPHAATREQRWRDVQYLAEHVDYIENVLRRMILPTLHGTSLSLAVGDRIFVAHDDSNKICSNQACAEAHKDTPERNNGIRIITMEPFLHWGTIAVAHDLHIAAGVVLAFRRNGPLMDDPLWTQYVGKLLPKELRAYCTDCLEELWARRREAWEIIDQPTSNVGHGHLPMQPIQRPRSDPETYYQIKNIEPETRDEISNLVCYPFALDGASAEIQNARGGAIENSVIDCSVKVKEPVHLQPSLEKADTPLNNDCTSSQPAHTANYIVVHSRTVFLDAAHDCQLPTLTTNLEEHERLGSTSIKDSVPDFGSGNREHGRRIDTDSVCRFFTSRARYRLAMLQQKDADQHGYFSSLNEPTPSTPKRMASADVKVRASEISSSPSDLPAQDIYTPILYYSKGHRTGQEETYSADPNLASSNFSNHQVSPPIPYTGKGKAKALPLNTTSPSPLPKPSSKLQPPFAPIFRKDNPATQVTPPGVSELEHTASLTRLPAKDDIICICGKPAQTFDVRIAQCITPDCPIGWVHYDCMDTKFKRCIRHRTQKCEICRNEEHFAEVNRQGSWSGEDAVSSAQRPAFLGLDAVTAALPNIGGFTAMSNPYGLADSGPVGGKTTTLSPLAPSFIPGQGASETSGQNGQTTVGSALTMGLVPARPHLFTEAYTNARELSRQADERWTRIFLENAFRVHEDTAKVRIAARLDANEYAYDEYEWDDEMDMGEI